LNEYINNSNRTVTVKAYLLEYKAIHYSVEKQELHETKKIDKELGLVERTLSDWKKVYAFTTENDTAFITGYKGSEIVVTVPEKIGRYSVVGIGDFAFSPKASGIVRSTRQARESIISVVIPESVTTISNNLFEGCYNLTSVTIPNSVNCIGKNAFKSCSNLQSITIPDGIEEIKEGVFENCYSLTNLTIPSSVNCIGESAFSGCDSLVSIKIPDGVTYIGKSAFRDCEKLSNIKLPDSVINIDRFAFWGCDRLNEINIPDGVEVIKWGLFYNCRNFYHAVFFTTYADITIL
jgi:hypothetical protein